MFIAGGERVRWRRRRPSDDGRRETPGPSPHLSACDRGGPSRCNCFRVAAGERAVLWRDGRATPMHTGPSKDGELTRRIVVGRVDDPAWVGPEPRYDSPARTDSYRSVLESAGRTSNYTRVYTSACAYRYGDVALARTANCRQWDRMSERITLGRPTIQSTTTTMIITTLITISTVIFVTVVAIVSELAGNTFCISMLFFIFYYCFYYYRKCDICG